MAPLSGFARLPTLLNAIGVAMCRYRLGYQSINYQVVLPRLLEGGTERLPNTVIMEEEPPNLRLPAQINLTKGNAAHDVCNLLNKIFLWLR